jgi:Na+/proline symporter
MMAASAAPMFLGVLWRRATRVGSITGFIVGGVTFSILHSGLLDPTWFVGSSIEIAGVWLAGQASNPFACATLGGFASISSMVAVSLVTEPPSDEHLAKVFGT